MKPMFLCSKQSEENKFGMKDQGVKTSTSDILFNGTTFLVRGNLIPPLLANIYVIISEDRKPS